MLLIGCLWVATSGAGSAEVVADITLDRQPAAIWLDTAVGDAGGGELRVKVLTPRKDDSRSVWQVCSFPSADGGSYRCGLDREAVEREPGQWVARALLDGERIGRREFWIR